MILLKECNTVVKRMSKKLPCCERRLRLFGVKTLNGRTLVGINHYGRTAACDGIYLHRRALGVTRHEHMEPLYLSASTASGGS